MSDSLANMQSTSTSASFMKNDLAALAADIAVDGVLPRTELELAAALESHGINDTIATHYGADDVFVLARKMLEAQPSIAATTESGTGQATVAANHSHATARAVDVLYDRHSHGWPAFL